MIVRIGKSTAHGRIPAPPSKSVAHRILICAALAEGKTVVENLSLSDDIRATIACIESLGASVTFGDGCCYLDGDDALPLSSSLSAPKTHTLTITGTGGKPHISGTFPCNESGSTLRFILPLALLACGGDKAALFEGTQRLIERGIGVYEEALSSSAVFAFSAQEKNEKQENVGTISVDGTLEAGKYRLRGDISSQFVSGLLFALPLLRGDSEIEILPPTESAGYIRLTMDTLRLFGVNIEKTSENSYFIGGGQTYRPPLSPAFPFTQNETEREIDSDGFKCPSAARYGEEAGRISVEGDWSNSAFLFALNALGGNVYVSGLSEKSAQSDKKCLDFLQKISRGFAEIDLSDYPDLAPILFSVAAAKHGGVFTGTRRLKLKESDRAAAMQAELKKFGIDAEIKENAVEICPAREALTPNEPLSSHGDHRIAMALAVLCTLTGGTIEGAEAVKKSYPSFFSDLSSLGVEITVI